MTRVLIMGDSHSDGNFMANVLRKAKESDVTSVVQLGDFGFTFDKNMIHSINSWLDRDEDNVFTWIDGNHDDHDFIEQVILDGERPTMPVSMAGIIYGKNTTFHDRLLYAPRGAVWNIGKRRCMALGGAFSIDKMYRTPGRSWWHQELIRDEDIDIAVENARELGPIDVMFTHDVPICHVFEDSLYNNGYKVGPESLYNRQQLTRAVRSIRPATLYHGHYHHRHDDEHITDDGHTVRVHGIGANVNNGYIDHTATDDWNFVVREW